MSTRIYQAYYKQEQIPNLDPEFTPYDNTSNPVNNLYEHYIYHQVRKISLAENIERWGVFSWQWKKKLRTVSAEDVVKIVNSAPQADVIIFNAYPDDELVAYSVWEQGAWSHPYILVLGHRLLEIMGEDPTLIYQPMDFTTYLAANYFVGNAKFWDGLLEFLDRYVAAIDSLDDEYKQMLYSSAGYEPNPKLDYTGFICERLISTYLLKMNNQIVIGAYTYGEHQLRDIKHNAIKTHNKELILEWDRQRPAHGAKIATEWIEKYF
jgi:hypothetical protein